MKCMYVVAAAVALASSALFTGCEKKDEPATPEQSQAALSKQVEQASKDLSAAAQKASNDAAKTADAAAKDFSKAAGSFKK